MKSNESRKQVRNGEQNQSSDMLTQMENLVIYERLSTLSVKHIEAVFENKAAKTQNGTSEYVVFISEDDPQAEHAESQYMQEHYFVLSVKDDGRISCPCNEHEGYDETICRHARACISARKGQCPNPDCGSYQFESVITKTAGNEVIGEQTRCSDCMTKFEIESE